MGGDNQIYHKGVIAVGSDIYMDPNNRHGALERKRPGRHRWMVVVAFAISEDRAKKAHEGTERIEMDLENMIDLSMGCVDCEEPYPGLQFCPAPEYKGFPTR